MITTAMEPMNVSFATTEGHWDLPGAPATRNAAATADLRTRGRPLADGGADEGHWDLPGAPPEPRGHAPQEGDTCCLATRAARRGTSLLLVIGAQYFFATPNASGGASDLRNGFM